MESTFVEIYRSEMRKVAREARQVERGVGIRTKKNGAKASGAAFDTFSICK